MLENKLSQELIHLCKEYLQYIEAYLAVLAYP